jgi:hypothetical protein
MLGDELWGELTEDEALELAMRLSSAEEEGREEAAGGDEQGAWAAAEARGEAAAAAGSEPAPQAGPRVAGERLQAAHLSDEEALALALAASVGGADASAPSPSSCTACGSGGWGAAACARDAAGLAPREQSTSEWALAQLRGLLTAEHPVDAATLYSLLSAEPDEGLLEFACGFMGEHEAVVAFALELAERRRAAGESI